MTSCSEEGSFALIQNGATWIALMDVVAMLSVHMTRVAGIASEGQDSTLVIARSRAQPPVQLLQHCLSEH